MNYIKEAYCTACGKLTYFYYDGENWECQECERLNTQEGSADSEKSTTYDEYED